MPNVQQTKHAMRTFIGKHSLTYHRMNLTSDTWGIGARVNSWRITRSRGKASTQKAAVDRILFPPPLHTRIVTAAENEVGVKEHPAGSNDGPRVHDYQSATGAYRQPWCASFVVWCYRKAGYAGLFPPLPAYVPSWTEMVRSRSRGWKPVAFNDARGGDVVTLWESGHIEIVHHREGEWLRTIGGNTSPVGQDNNGGMVARCSRNRSEITVVGRPA